MVMEVQEKRSEIKESPSLAAGLPSLDADRYELLEEVGQGGMATVYRGRDTLLGREVAIKVLHPHLAKDPNHRERFRREAQTIARLQHPSIVKIYDVSAEGRSSRSSIFLVMEFIRGRTLQDFLEQRELPLCELAAALVVSLALALEHAHQQQIIHRDLKPENVMIQEDGTPKLTDFGLARILDDDAMTRTGTILGSPAYMAPEQVQGLPGDHRTDLFALGVILYRLVCRQHPFLLGPKNNPASILQAVSSGQYPDPEKLRPGAGREISRIIKKALALEPHTRYQSAHEMRCDLQAYLQASGLQEPERSIQRYFLHPQETALALDTVILDTLRKRAFDLCDEGRLAAALDICNRLLDLRPADPQIRDLIHQISQRSKRPTFRLLSILAASTSLLLVISLAYLWHSRSSLPSETSPPSPLSEIRTATTFASSDPLARTLRPSTSAPVSPTSPRDPQPAIPRPTSSTSPFPSPPTLRRPEGVAEPLPSRPAPPPRRRDGNPETTASTVPTQATAPTQAAEVNTPPAPIEIRLSSAWASRPIQRQTLRFRYLPRRRLLFLDSRSSGQIQTHQGKRLALVRGRPLALRLSSTSEKANRFVLLFPKRPPQPIVFRLPSERQPKPNPRLPSAAPPPPNKVIKRSFVIITQPWADIALLEEGEKIGRISKEAIRTPLRLEAGRTYTLEASNPGCLPLRLQIQIPTEGPICSLQGTLCKPLSPERDGTPALRVRLPWRSATLQISSVPSSRLYISGEFWAEVTSKTTSIPIEIKGTNPRLERLLMLSAPGYRPWNRRVTFRPGQPLTFHSIRLAKE